MTTYWNTAFKKRDYECTNIVAIKAEQLPKRFDPAIWKTDPTNRLNGLQYLGAEYSNGERFELYGYL